MCIERINLPLGGNNCLSGNLDYLRTTIFRIAE